MGIVVAPPQLNVDPVLRCGAAIKLVSLLMKKAGLGNLPLERSEQQDVSAARVHLVRLSGVNSFLLHTVNFK